jgi:hypothetical protein
MQMMIRSKEAGWSGPINPWYVDVGIPDAVHFESLDRETSSCYTRVPAQDILKVILAIVGGRE